MQRTPLPDDLPDVFEVSQAVALGAKRDRLRRADLSAPFHGVRVKSDTLFDGGDEEEQLVTRARHYSARMLEEEFFSHETAARLWGLPVPRTVTTPPLLDVTVPTPLRAPRSRGVRGHQVREHLVRVVEHRGFRLSDPATTWVMLANRLREVDLVCAGDALIRDLPDPGHPAEAPRRHPLADRRDVLHALEMGRRPGLVRLRRAAEHLSERSRSPAETRTRLLLAASGLPSPELNLAIHDRDGRLLAEVDLAFPLYRVGVEYEGDHHRTDTKQFQHDIERIERLTSHGWRIVRLVSAHVYGDPDEAVRRVRSALASRGWWRSVG